ncbi:MAG TPA: caspase domain-containing protein [Longimicrobium sp.]|nr:caspase domain-containing protein [Longimicrobium sp.]
MNRTLRPLRRQAALLAVLSALLPATLLAQAERRVALIIGNGAYQNVGPLRNPVNDARAMAQTLSRMGFEVLLREDRTEDQVKQDIREWGRQLDQNSVALFYYSGHGIQVKGENYVVPVDAEIASEEEVEYSAINVGLVMAQMERARSRVNIVFLDACRNNPFARSFRSAAQGLAMVNAPAGTFIAYATAPGDVASDGTAAAGNGLYTQQLLRFLNTPGLPIEQMHKQVRIAVSAASNGDQVPWESSSIMGDFFFAGSGGQGSVHTATSTPANRPEALAEAESGADATALRPGQPQRGTLVRGDATMDDGSLFDLYTYDARAGERLTFTMRSGEFDTFLTVARLNNGQAELLVRDDDSGGGTNSRAELTVDRDGPIFIVANALREGMTGSYTIELAAAGGSTRITSGQRVTGTLARTDPMLGDSSYVDTYTYQGRQGERVRIAMTSSAFDTYLSIGEIVDGRYNELERNDDADGTNSVIEVVLPRPGTYQIRANSFLKHQTGSYTLEIRPANGARPQQPAQSSPNSGGVIRRRTPGQQQPSTPSSGGVIRRRPPGS